MEHSLIIMKTKTLRVNISVTNFVPAEKQKY